MAGIVARQALYAQGALLPIIVSNSLGTERRAGIHASALLAADGKRKFSCREAPYENIHEARIELRTGTSTYLRDGLGGVHPQAIGPGTRHRIVAIGYADDSSLERNTLAHEAVGIASAIPSLMVAANGRSESPQVDHLLDEGGSDGRMALHSLELGRIERAWFTYYAVRYADFADIVEMPCDTRRLDFPIAHSQSASQNPRKLGDTVRVAPSVTAFGIESRREGLDQIDYAPGAAQAIIGLHQYPPSAWSRSIHGPDALN
jgi:hypothetical protein